MRQLALFAVLFNSVLTLPAPRWDFEAVVRVHMHEHEHDSVLNGPLHSQNSATTDWIEEAEEAARWLDNVKQTQGNATTWPTSVPDVTNGTFVGDLYYGVPGIIVFYLELAAATGNSSYTATAVSGGNYLCLHLQDLLIQAGNQSGFYTGTAGLGFVFHTLSQRVDAPASQRFAHAATVVDEHLLKIASPQPKGGVTWNGDTDVIFGAAGTGLYLLYASEMATRANDTILSDRLLSMASEAGKWLITQAISSHGGLTWTVGALLPDYEAPNFSHGTAGISYFLATLHRATGDRRSLDTALAGARFLSAIANKTGDGFLVFHDNSTVGQGVFYLGWCGGPPGTARLFWRLWQVTGDVNHLKAVRGGLMSIRESHIPTTFTSGFWNNVGQCCGNAGVSELFAHMASAAHPHLPDPSALLSFAHEMAANAAQRARRVRTAAGPGLEWPDAENNDHRKVLTVQTGYMQGAAGIGSNFLHLHAIATGHQVNVDWPDAPYGHW